MLDGDVRDLLQRYVDGNISNLELAEWLVQVEYDREIAEESRDALAGLRLTVLEVEEGRRPVASVLEDVTSILARARPSEIVLAARSGSETAWAGEPSLTAAPSQIQRAGI